jgi:thioredoxin reductase (NADPH)
MRGWRYMLDALIVGAGPCGIAASAAMKRYGLDHVVLEKSCIVSTLYRFPTNMIFNSTPQLLEVGDIPFYTTGPKPNRSEALTYYRTVVDRLGLPVRQYEKVVKIEPLQDQRGFLVHSQEQIGTKRTYEVRHVVLATGYFDTPNMLGVEGEELPHVSHYYQDAHPYYGQDVLVIGGTNSAAEAVLELHRTGARVTLVHRGETLSSHIKPWIRPEIQSLIEKQAIPVYFRSHVRKIHQNGQVDVETPEGMVHLYARQVFALIGYRPDLTFIRSLGIKVDDNTGIPVHDPDTLETNIPGIFLAGVVISGYNANRIFIENGRLHGEQIAQTLVQRKV